MTIHVLFCLSMSLYKLLCTCSNERVCESCWGLILKFIDLGDYDKHLELIGSDPTFKLKVICLKKSFKAYKPHLDTLIDETIAKFAQNIFHWLRDRDTQLKTALNIEKKAYDTCTCTADNKKLCTNCWNSLLDRCNDFVVSDNALNMLSIEQLRTETIFSEFVETMKTDLKDGELCVEDTVIDNFAKDILEIIQIYYTTNKKSNNLKRKMSEPETSETPKAPDTQQSVRVQINKLKRKLEFSESLETDTDSLNIETLKISGSKRKLESDPESLPDANALKRKLNE